MARPLEKVLEENLQLYDRVVAMKKAAGTSS
jgi:hypothetical protein